jgi:hypothetical protein
LSLFSADSDFIECQRIIKEELGTKLFTICPPVTRIPIDHPNFMGTKPEVIINEYSTWICAFNKLPDNYFLVPEYEYPNDLGKGYLYNGTRAQRRDVKKRRREFAVEYVDMLRERIGRVKVQVLSNSEPQILA